MTQRIGATLIACSRRAMPEGPPCGYFAFLASVVRVPMIDDPSSSPTRSQTSAATVEAVVAGSLVFCGDPVTNDRPCVGDDRLHRLAACIPPFHRPVQGAQHEHLRDVE